MLDDRRIAITGTLPAVALAALSGEGYRIVNSLRHEEDMWALYLFNQNFPYTVPSWLNTEPWQNPHEFKARRHTGVRAAKRAAKKRRRSKKS